MTNNTEFIRVVKNKNFTILNNEFLKRKDLSWKAKGILAYVLSLPDDWKINMNEIVKNATDGRDSFRSGWKELKKAGYIDRYPVKDKDTKKIVRWETKIFESVDLKQSEPQTEKPQVGNPQMEKPIVENPKLLSTDITKDLNKQNTDNTKEKHSPDSANAKYDDDSPYMKLAVRLHEHIKQRNPKQKEPNWQTWADDFRKTVKLDDRELNEVVKVLDWCQKDDFWQNNVLSPAKFRKQYDQLFLKMTKETGYGGSSYGGLEF